MKIFECIVDEKELIGVMPLGYEHKKERDSYYTRPVITVLLRRYNLEIKGEWYNGDSDMLGCVFHNQVVVALERKGIV